ncbi:calcium/sodium antiporter [Frigidibacter albus]|uniref:Calcium/sodium antiporter n=1 Tax=Frigidibacter albus TaxID=1465486 RepID=A0A6L8VLD1_9RHOB|nr:calcium/sodium antiporter [Frigidibacter albus]MZQ90581.1 calcium/sodium antiporter [Frigidibacter albus]NBE32763.1 calcium/sodium antiporter [Frigidibacter albus]
MTYLFLVIGLVGLFVGGEFLVRGAVGIARKFGLSPLVIGLTVVGFGTSMPELLVSVQAALGGTPAIAMGNVVGSNIANILLILGVAAVIAPVSMTFGPLRRDLVVMLAATLVLWGMILNGYLGRLEGFILFAGLLGFLWAALRSGKEEETEEMAGVALPPLWRSVLIAVAGLAVLMISARLLIDAATELARDFGISEAVIGLTIVAIGTSLPELATSVVAAMRRQADIAVGNVVGSNIFNILGILGLTAIIAPIPVEPRFAGVDMAVAFAAAAGLAFISWKWARLGRPAGAGLLVVYVGYIAAMAVI